MSACTHQSLNAIGQACGCSWTTVRVTTGVPTNFISFYRCSALDPLPLMRGQGPTRLSEFSIPAFSETRNCSKLTAEKSPGLAISPPSTVPSSSRVSPDATVVRLADYYASMLACLAIESMLCHVLRKCRRLPFLFVPRIYSAND